MEKAKVYYTDFRTVAFGDGLPTKLKKLIKKAGIGQMDMDGKFVAIKMHFGELGNISFLRASFTYSPPATGTPISSVPLSPSPMMTGQPTVSGVKPFSHAQ